MELLNAVHVTTEDLDDPFASDEDEQEIENNEVFVEQEISDCESDND